MGDVLILYVYTILFHTNTTSPTDPHTTLYMVFLVERFETFTGYLIISSSS